MATRLNYNKESYNHSIKNAVIAGKMVSRTSGIATTAQIKYCKKLVELVVKYEVSIDPEYYYILNTKPMDRQDATFRITYLSNVLTKAGVPADEFSTYKFDARGNVIDQTGKIVKRRDGMVMKPNKIDIDGAITNGQEVL